MRIAVAGATGTIGGHVVRHVEAAGHHPLTLTRSAGVDLTSPSGVGDHLDDVDAVIDCLGTDAMRTNAALDFFSTTTRNLLNAERRAGVKHHVVLSIVGIDDATSGYYAGKLDQERIALTSGQPVTVLRSTQFFEFAEQMLTRGRLGPVVLAPRMTCAPVSADEVAHELVELATRPAQGTRLQMAGPETLQMVDMTRRLAKRRHLRAAVFGLRMPGANGRTMRDGSLIPPAPDRRGRQSFDEWLDQNA